MTVLKKTNVYDEDIFFSVFLYEEKKTKKLRITLTYLFRRRLLHSRQIKSNIE